MKIEIRIASMQERNYSYSQDTDIRSRTGNIGYLRADMGSNGQGFYSTWFDFRNDLKTDEFKAEFDDVINQLREDFLKDRRDLSRFCYANPGASNEDFRDFFFRADTEKYSYMLRLNPNRGEYNMY